jgi:hypothetical protein
MATSTRTPLTPGATVTHYKEKADEMKKLIDQLREVIPAIAVPDDMTLDRRGAAVKDSFIATAVGMYDGIPDVQSVPAIDLTDARDTLQYMEAFRPMLLLLESQVVRYLKMQFKVRKLRATENALLVYQLAKMVSRATPDVDLAPHIGSLKSQLGKKKKVKAATTAPTTPAPSGSTTDPAKTIK